MSRRRQADRRRTTLAGMTTLFDPLRLGDIELASRVVMAPLTRNRAGLGRVPTSLTVEYYAQRANPAAGAGLIVTEGVQVDAIGQGYLDTPGMYSPEQVAAWRRVTDAVHANGGRIVAQIWHVGRISHTSLLPEGGIPVSSTARTADTRTFTTAGFVPVSSPRALALHEISGVVDQYRHAARCAIDAGFDGVEVHGANGYLVEQFLKDSTNDRTDAYGGSIANRVRFAVEVMRAVAGEIGAGRAGLRISPVTPANDVGQDSDPQALYGHLLTQLAPLGLAFIEVVEGATGGPRDNVPFDWAALRAKWPGAWIANNGYGRDMALAAVAEGRADAIAFGRSFISNPDLGRRLRENLPLAKANSATFYGGGAEGYTDYPAYDASIASTSAAAT
jgi:N-ethylmaleimide reductase